MIKSTPWGKPDDCDEIADGIRRYYTASHGGYWISQERRRQMPEALQLAGTWAGGNWYEEDCDWCLVYLSFPAEFAKFEPDRFEKNFEAARHTLRNWKWRTWEALYGRELAEGESYCKDQDLWEEKTKDLLTVRSCITNYHDIRIPPDHVGVFAQMRSHPELYQDIIFLVPEAEYNPARMIIEEGKYKTIKEI